MSNRRQFLKSAGLLGLAPFSNALPAQTPDTEDRRQPQQTPAETLSSQGRADAIVIENAEMRLTISSSGFAQSLIHKMSGQECLMLGTDTPMFTLTQYRPYDNELQLSYPAKITHFPSDRVRRSNNKLVVNFALVGYEASIGLTITDDYIAFRLENLIYKGYTSLRHKRKTTVDELLFVQLPIRNRKNLGDWLNVMWDENVAVNVLATDPYAQIDAKPRRNYHLFQAGSVRDVKLTGMGAALITTKTDRLLDRIARVEEDFNLPRGVQSRRCKEYGSSYYEVSTITPKNVDTHIKYARMSGLKAMDVYYIAFAQTAGHFPWRPEYPRGMTDLQEVVAKISAAGIIPGIHIHYSKAHKEDAYVTPEPDPRLNLRQSFILSKSIDAETTEISIEQDPHLCTMEDDRRILRIQNELITYERYTEDPPYRFENCRRGALGTQAAAHRRSSQVGLLDVDTWPVFVRFTQDTSIQSEVADRLKTIYEQAGFKFVYYDGAEDVPPPYWYTVSRAQWVVNRMLKPKPLFAEGACKSHFSWHILTRGNAFDVFKPEVMKAATREYPAAEIPQVAKDFTSINFGWIGYWAPSSETIGTQPDMLEYVTSRAAAWDCPVSLVGDIEAMEAHPRTTDNLEVIRRWEEVRTQKWLTQAQKIALRNLEQEHILLVDKDGKFVLRPYKPIENVAGKNAPGRAFIFEHKGNVWVVYWHTSGEGLLHLPLPVERMTLMREPGKPIAIQASGRESKLPIGERRYLAFKQLASHEVVSAFQNAKLIST